MFHYVYRIVRETGELYLLQNERKLWNVVSLMRSLPECRSFERWNKIQSSKLSVATWIFPRNLSEFDRLPCVRTYARIRTATRLRVVPLSHCPSCVTRTKIVRKNGRVKSWGREARASSPQDFTRPFLSHDFLSRHARRTKRKRDYT